MQEGSLEINRDANDLCGGLDGEDEMPPLEEENAIAAPIQESSTRVMVADQTLGNLCRLMENFGKDLKDMRQENKEMRQENLERRDRERKVDERQAALEAQVQELWLEFREKKTSTPERKPARDNPIPKPRKEQPGSFSTIEQPPSHSYTLPTALSVHTKDAPTYCAKTSCADPIARNQELEDWLTDIKVRYESLPDSRKIALAKAQCRGDAGELVASKEFHTCHDWCEFEKEMRYHFRVRTCAGTAMSQLSEMKLKPDQTPADFYQKIRSLSLAGAREHPGSYKPKLFTRHFFFKGLPNWLQDLSGPMNGGSMRKLVERVEENWERRKDAVRTGTVRGASDRNDYPAQAAALEEEEELAREIHELKVTRRPDGRPPLRGEAGRPWPNPPAQLYAQERRRNLVCFACNRVGHYARQCPFLDLRGEQAPLPSEGLPQWGTSRYAPGPRGDPQQPPPVRHNESER